MLGGIVPDAIHSDLMGLLAFVGVSCLIWVVYAIAKANGGDD